MGMGGMGMGMDPFGGGMGMGMPGGGGMDGSGMQENMLFGMMGIESDMGPMGMMDPMGGMGMPGGMGMGPMDDPFGGQSFVDFRNEVLFSETSADNFFDDFGPMGGMGMMDPKGGIDIQKKK